MKSFKHFILEGGNIEIGGVKAQPIKINAKNRESKANDVHEALSALHDSFHKEHGEHLYGKDKKALTNGSVYSGSTKHLMDKKISHEEFAKHKPEVGDVDTKIPIEHSDKLHSHLATGRKFGKYTVVGVKRSGTEHHALMKHDNGEVHQFDFEKTHYQNHEPSKFDQFSHSSDWEDTKKSIKGAHHKILLNAVGGEKHKFSTAYGLAPRTKEKTEHWENDTHKMAHTLFGKGADESHMHSFHGLTKLIKKHMPAEQHQQVYDKFKSSMTKEKKINSDHALKHLRDNLNVKD